MEKIYIEDKTFERMNYTESGIARGEYDHCVFIDCDFTRADLSESVFIDCSFTGCNLSLVKLDKTAFKGVQFTGCKMLGMLFEIGDPFGLSFSVDNCMLDQSSFFGLSLKKMKFSKTQLREVDFTRCDLTQSVFDACDLTGARFDNTILEKADLRTAFNYSMDPEINRLKKAKFSLAGAGGLLEKYGIDLYP